MAQAPKLIPEEWAEVRKVWELDSREGYAWVARELQLPVSPPAIRKKSMIEHWKKAVGVETPVHKPASKMLGQSGAPDECWTLGKVSEREFQDVFVERLRTGSLAAKLGWPGVVSVMPEYRIGQTICDVVVFHSDGSITICELKREGMQLRDYMTGIGQLLNASVQFGLSLLHQNARRTVRLALSVPGRTSDNLGYACVKAGIEYVPFGVAWAGHAVAQARVGEMQREGSCNG